MDAAVIILSGEILPVGERLCEAFSEAVAGISIRFDESKCAVVEHNDLNAALVYGVMMEAAQAYEVAELSFAAVSPVLDMMPVDESLVSASREATTFVASVQRAAEWGGNSTGLAANVEGIAILVLDYRNDACVTR